MLSSHHHAECLLPGCGDNQRLGHDSQFRHWWHQRNNRGNHHGARFRRRAHVTTLAGNGQSGIVDGPGGPDGTAELDEFEGIAVDAAGNVYVSDTNCVRKIDPNGNVTTLARNINIFPTASVDGTGGPNGTAQFLSPWGIGVDADGNIYVADYSANNVRKD